MSHNHSLISSYRDLQDNHACRTTLNNRSSVLYCFLLLHRMSVQYIYFFWTVWSVWFDTGCELKTSGQLFWQGSANKHRLKMTCTDQFPGFAEAYSSCISYTTALHQQSHGKHTVTMSKLNWSWIKGLEKILIDLV